MAVGVERLLQVLFVYNVAQSVLPFFKHSFALLPLWFVFLGAVVNVLVVAVFFVAGDSSVEVFQVTSKAALSRSSSGSTSDVSGMRQYVFPVQHELFCRTVITQTTIYAASLFCLVAWLFACIERGYQLYVLPMLLDLRLVQSHAWADLEDWSKLDIAQQQERNSA